MMEPDLKLMDEKVRLAYRVARNARDPRDPRDGRDASNSQAGLPSEPPAALDDAIRAAARRAVAAKPVSIQKTSPSKWNKQWATPLAAAATVLLTASILFVALDENPDVLEAPSQVSQTTALQPAAVRQQASVAADRVAEISASPLAKGDTKNMAATSPRAVTGPTANPMPATPATSAGARPERSVTVTAAQIATPPPIQSAHPAPSAVRPLTSPAAPSLSVLSPSAISPPAISPSAPPPAPSPSPATTLADAARLNTPRLDTPRLEERRRTANGEAVASIVTAPITPKTAVSQPIERPLASSAELSLAPAKPKFEISAAKKSAGPAVGKITTNNVDSNSTENQTTQKFESSGKAASELKPAKDNTKEQAEAADLWIARLTELNRQNKTVELTEELKRFRKRYPMVELPKPLAEAWAKIVVE